MQFESLLNLLNILLEANGWKISEILKALMKTEGFHTIMQVNQIPRFPSFSFLLFFPPKK